MAAGTPFALAHTFAQTGPFRPPNVERRVPGLFFAGSGTVPGVGRADGAGLGEAGSPARGDLPGRDRPGRRGPRRMDGCARAIGAARSSPATTARRTSGARRCSPGRSASTSTPSTPSVDSPTTSWTIPKPERSGPGVRGRRLHGFADRFRADLAAGDSATRCWPRSSHTARSAEIDPECFDRFFGAMAMDLTDDLVRDVGRPARLHGGIRGGDRGDDAAGAGAARPGRQTSRPRRSAWHSSSPTSCATSTRTWTGAGSTCRRRISSGSGSTSGFVGRHRSSRR